MNDNNCELKSLTLLEDSQAELCDALNSLGGHEVDGLLDRFPFISATHINRAVEGYLRLRKAGRSEASKLLIRSALETVIRLRAAQAKPELMFRIVFSEFEEDKKWIRALDGPSKVQVLDAMEKEWQEFKNAYSAKYPHHSAIEEKLGVEAAAKASGMEKYYNTHYRLYCRFTHANLQAMIGGLSGFESEDNRTMTLCALAAIEALNSIGANTTKLQALMERLEQKAFHDESQPPQL